MATDLTLPVREAVTVFLRASSPLVATDPHNRAADDYIFGEVQPANTPYPFIRFGSPDTTPLEFSCFDGCSVSAAIHVFGDDEAQVKEAAAVLVAVLDGKSVPLEGGGELDARWTGGPTFRDPEEPDIWHAVRNFDFEASL
jgi:hypothetical protein